MTDKEFAAQLLLIRKRMHGYCKKLTKNRHAAEDLLQSSSLRMWEKRDKFIGERADLINWALTIIYHENINSLRKLKGKDFLPLTSEFEGISFPAQEPSILVREMVEKIMLLPPWQREVLLNITTRAKSYEETAKLMNINVGTVRSRLSRTRNNLRELYK